MTSATTCSRYVTYARSFKSGGINLSGLPLDANNQPITAVETVEPESTNHYEAGLKTQLFSQQRDLEPLGLLDRHHRLSGDGDQQPGQRDPRLSRECRQGSRARCGAGIEHASDRQLAAVRQRLVHGPRVCEVPRRALPAGTVGRHGGLALRIRRAHRERRVASARPSCNISGQWLPGISKIALSYGLEYDLPVSAFGPDGGAYFAFDGSYRSKFSSNPSRSIYTDVGGYSLANFRAGARFGDGWNVYGWVRNAFAKDYYEFLSTQSGSTGLVVAQLGDPRTYGLTVNKSF